MSTRPSSSLSPSAWASPTATWNAANQVSTLLNGGFVIVGPRGRVDSSAMSLTIPDFAAIPPQGLDLPACHVVLGVLHDPHCLLPLVCKLPEVSLPDLLSVFIRKVRVVYLDVNPADEGLVEGSHPVRGEEEDASEILQGPKEARHQVVALNVLDPALFHVDVSLIDEHNGVPAVSELEPFLQIFLDR